MRNQHWSHRHPSRHDRRQVVITGVGAICAAGIGADVLWDALLNRHSGISEISRFDTSGMQSRIAGEVKGFDPIKLIPQRLRPRRLSRQSQFALVASREAVTDAGLKDEELRARKSGVVLGSATANVEMFEETTLKVHERGPRYGAGAGVPMMNMQSQSTALVEMLGLEEAPALCISASCVSGFDAIAVGCDMIRAGRVDAMVCGGTEAPLTRMSSSVFQNAGMCSMRNDEPERASRPFDRERDNGLLAEGAGIVVIETLDSALARGAKPYAEILGYSKSRDQTGAAHGSGLVSTMRGALENAGCLPSEIDCVSAWGAGDPTLDREETRAIKEVFGTRAYDIAIHSIKAITGNPLAAAGALQMVCAALSFRHGIVPPTTNYEHRDIDCDLDYTAGKPRRMRVRHMMLNGHGLGGGNTSMVLGALGMA